MATIRSFEELEIWKMARDQANEIYKLTQADKFSRDFALKDQINAAAGSVMDNIAEGFERYSNKEFSQFLVIAKGSNAEVRSQLFRARDRNYISDSILSERIDFSTLIGKKIKTLFDYLQSSTFKTKPTPKPQPITSSTPNPTSNFQPPTPNP
jgi:four helix bundle protein